MTAITSMEQLGSLIRATRKSQGLRQPDLAGACGTSVRFVVELERGKPTAQIGKVLHVLAMLGLRVDIAPGRHS
jgi:HTH-type transcriptional regulator / antitoxin HipB